jgi:HrpA-like RNA helicase
MCGESVRVDSKVSDATRLIFVTKVVLLRRLMNDPEMSGKG